MSTTTMSTTTPNNRDASNGDLRFVIIGAGMAGILAAIKLREAGFDNLVIYEKNEGIGGTWYENTYPGLACDVPSHLYSYSFAPNPEWSQQFSPGAEIRKYFEDVARQFEVDSLVRFNTEITSCEFADGRWRLEASDGSRDEGDFVIAATGVLHHPNLPEFEGMESFRGAVFHSARWNHDVPTAGRRVGVIGTGSSAIQIITALVEEVAELILFQRTAQWIMPVTNQTYGSDDRADFRSHPESMKKLREQISRAFIDGFANILVDADSPMLQAIHETCENHLENSVRDPVLREKLRPTYRAACKRLVMSGGFYDAIQHPNAKVVCEAIERIEPTGVRTEDGQLHELDVLVLATGFRVDRFVRPMHVVGRGGVALDDVWANGPSAYMAITVPDFPNFFMLNGPNAPVGNFSLIDVAEMQFAYIMQLVERVRCGECKELSVSHEAMRQFDTDRLEAAKTTIWNTGCKSWYLDENGLPSAWPWTFDRFTEEMSRPRMVDFEVK